MPNLEDCPTWCTGEHGSGLHESESVAVAVVGRGEPSTAQRGIPGHWYVSVLHDGTEHWVDIGDDFDSEALCVGSARRLYRALGDAIAVLG